MTHLTEDGVDFSSGGKSSWGDVKSNLKNWGVWKHKLGHCFKKVDNLFLKIATSIM